MELCVMRPTAPASLAAEGEGLGPGDLSNTEGPPMPPCNPSGVTGGDKRSCVSDIGVPEVGPASMLGPGGIGMSGGCGGPAGAVVGGGGRVAGGAETACTSPPVCR